MVPFDNDHAHWPLITDSTGRSGMQLVQETHTHHPHTAVIEFMLTLMTSISSSVSWTLPKESEIELPWEDTDELAPVRACGEGAGSFL